MPIGDYIHYHLSRYHTYGIRDAFGESGEKGNRGIQEGIRAYAAQKGIIHKRANSLMKLEDDVIKDIEAKLNFLMGNGKKSKQVRRMLKDSISEDYGIEDKLIDANTFKVTKDKSIVTKEEIEVTKNEYKSSFESGKIPNNTGRYYNTNKIGFSRAYLGKDTKKLGKEVEAQNIYLKNLVEKVQLIQRMMEKVPQEKKGRANLQNKVDNAINMIKEFFNQNSYTEELLNTKGISPEFKNCKILVDNLKNFKNSEGVNINLIDAVNSLLSDSLLFPNNRAMEAQGALAETAVAVSLMEADLNAVITVDDYIQSKSNNKEGVVGNKYAKQMTFSKNFLTKQDAALGKFSASFSTGYGQGIDAIYALEASTGKVDVEVTYKSNFLPISVKNYSLAAQRNISLVSGTNLLYLIQDENSNYVNHYLNAIAYHKDMYLDYGSGNYREQSYLATAYTVLYKAFTGDSYGRDIADKAEVFIVHDTTAESQRQSWRVYSINSLLYSILNTAEQFNKYAVIETTGGFNGNGNLENLTIGNEFQGILKPYTPDVEDAYTRIGIFLGRVANVKLHAALKPAALALPNIYKKDNKK